MKKKLDGLWNEVKGIANNIVSNAVWELLQKVIVPAATVWCLAYWQIPLFVSFCISFFAVIGLVSLIIKYRHIDFHYMFNKKSIYFEYRETHSVYNTTLDIKALTNNVDRIYGRYTWDFRKVEMQCTNPSNATIIPLPINDTYQKYEVYLGGTKHNIGDKFSVSLSSKMNGDVQFPLFATTVIRPTNFLRIHIKLPLHLLKTHRIRLVTSPTPSEVGISETKSVALDEHGEYVWDIKHPKLTYEYAVEWDFIEEKSKAFEATQEP